MLTLQSEETEGEKERVHPQLTKKNQIVSKSGQGSPQAFLTRRTARPTVPRPPGAPGLRWSSTLVTTVSRLHRQSTGKPLRGATGMIVVKSGLG
jgi:hypothetical protein